MSTPHVYQAIAKVTAAMATEGISKSRKNQQQGYQFRGIDDVYNALSRTLSDNKLCILPSVLDRTCDERQSKSGGAMFYVTVRVRFDLVSAEDGTSHSVVTFGEAMDSGDKATNKAMSAAYKYAAMQTFCIPTEGDNDADAQTHEVQAKSKPAPAAQKTEPHASADQIQKLQDWQVVEGLPTQYLKAVTDALELDGALKLTAARAQKIIDGLEKSFNPGTNAQSQ